MTGSGRVLNAGGSRQTTRTHAMRPEPDKMNEHDARRISA